MVEMSQVLMERKADYSQIHDKASHGMVRDPVILNHKPLLNGDFEFLGRQYRSSSECSSDSQLDTLLEEADKIQTSKNGFRKGAPAKKQVRFNMERNKEHFYSYAQSSDDESPMSNVHFVDYNFHQSKGYGDEDDDSDDGDDDESDDDDDDDDKEGDWSEEDSTSEKFGYLVDKSSSSLEDNNNSTDSKITSEPPRLNGTIELVNGIDNTVGGKVSNGCLDHQNKQNDTLFEDKRLVDLRTQVLEMESSLRARQDSVQKEMANMSTRLKKAREETNQEMRKLQKELEDRKQQYVTEMKDIDRQREEQKKKFEEELEEFRNEKKLEERRQRYYEHEASISQMEKELNHRAQEVRERDKEIREYEEYLNRRHAVCNGKEEDLNVLQNELDILAQELEGKKTKLLNKHDQLVHQSSEEDIVVSTPPLRARPSSRASVNNVDRSASRVSISSKGVDLRIEELKSQNRQLLEELFTLRKACESKEEELAELKEKLGVSENETKRLQQRNKHLETQLELARKTAELGADSVSVDEIMRKTTQDMRSARTSRVLRPPRAVAPCSSGSSGIKLPRVSSTDSVGTKNTSSSDSGKGTKESGMKASKVFAGKKAKDDGDGRHKFGTEKTTSTLCAIM